MTELRNVAIIAHVDHGKTTLVDELFKQSGMFRDNEKVVERMMDSMDLEKERGITISSKTGGFEYKDTRINIIDTPGHADFGGQVERVLRMADGALLLVDAQEGPMPQTYFVLKKALSFNLPVIVVINKIDKPAARCDWAVDQVFDLFVKLDAPDHIMDFPVIYASAKNGFARYQPGDDNDTLEPLLDEIIAKIPKPTGDPEGPLQMQISSLDYSPYLGRLGIGKITNGRLRTNKDIAIVRRDGSVVSSRISKIYRFEANGKVPVEFADAGDIVAVAGRDDITVGVTYTEKDNPQPLPPLEIDPPTLAMHFVPNDSPFAGLEGDFVTSRQIDERLQRETLSDVALEVEELTESVGFRVAGRGELHLSILIERMRREGFEFQVTRPQVITKEVDGVTLEPYEDLTIDVDEQFMGRVVEKLGSRRGKMLSLEQSDGMARIVYRIPTRGILGFKSEFMTDTKGMGTMGYVFAEYGPWAGDIRTRKNGVLVAKEACKTAAYSLGTLQDRGILFVGHALDVYRGMIIGENARSNDLVVNPGKAKKLSNMRSSGTDDSVTLAPPRQMTLEDCISFIEDDELVEITPKNIRLRKREMKP
ncbi:MAG: GTP-binding protein [Bradymonadia bacterium]|jgi:GTP-binding protein